MNKVARTTLGGRIRAAWNALRGKPAGQITFGLRVIRCDECDRINRKGMASQCSEVGERGELYSGTMRRLARMGAKTHVEQIICLAEEIEHYRAQIIEMRDYIALHPSPADRCVCCGEIIPEGRMVCPNCENGAQSRERSTK